MNFMPIHQVVNILAERENKFKMLDKDTFQITHPNNDIEYLVELGSRRILVVCRKLNLKFEATDSETLRTRLDGMDAYLRELNSLDVAEQFIASTSKRFHNYTREEDAELGIISIFEDEKVTLQIIVTESYLRVRTLPGDDPEFAVTYHFDKVSLFQAVERAVILIDRL